MTFKPLLGNAEIYSIFCRDFSERKNSAKVSESFVGAGGQNPVFVQNRVSFLTFLKSTIKFNCSCGKTESGGLYNSDMPPTKYTKKHTRIIVNMFGRMTPEDNYELIYFLLLSFILKTYAMYKPSAEYDKQETSFRTQRKNMLPY